jgi:hypothetical protein
LILVAVCSRSGGQESEQPRPILPDPKLTPGDVFDVTTEDICVSGYARKVRKLTSALKRQAYAQYGITRWKTGDYEVDHLILLSLDDSNSIRNLWPQSTTTSPWNSHVKDVLERRLHNMVRAGKVDLQTALHEIATDWITAYQKYIAKSPPSSEMHEPQFAPETATGAKYE